MNLLRNLAAVLAAAASTAALANADSSLAIPARAQMAAALNLDSQRGEKVQAILADAKARMAVARMQLGAANDDASRAALLAAILLIRYETDAQLATVLTPEEFARFKEAVYPAGWVRGLPARGTQM
ncbi:MAG: hypothetical protein ACM3SO_03340 [Betaproteobacteria bacterium]